MATITHPRWLALVVTLTVVVLVLTAEHQIFDTNFYALWEATALLAGDHPYRDFFEWGVPLQAMVSAAAQQLVGYRLVGEFLVQWLFIVAGIAVSFDLALRASHSITASLVTTVLALALLATTPTFHYPKLFFYPMAVWLMWWYLDRPSARRAAVLGCMTAVAFLFRHDHGVYIAGAAALTFGTARLAMPPSRSLSAALAESAVYGATVVAVLAPWAIVVHTNEGLPEYVRSRAQLYREWSASRSPYPVLLNMNPVRVLTPARLPAAKPDVVSFEWNPSVDEAQRKELEKQYGLRFLQGPDEDGRWRYEAPNVYDVGLLDLNTFITSTQGIEWDRLQQARGRIPTRANAQLWLEQTALLVPLLLLVSAAADCFRSWYRAESLALGTYRIALAATFLAIIDARLFREASYVVVVAPLTAALGTRLLVGNRRVDRSSATDPYTMGRSLWRMTRRALALGMLLITGVMTFAYARNTYIFQPFALARTVPRAFRQLLVSPPIDGNLTAEEALQYDQAVWNSRGVDKGSVMMRYLHDCTSAGDRVLGTGSTPYHSGYYIERPIAGGQLFWHHRWRSDAAHEMQSLTLLQQQSVPFAFSTHDPVLEDFKRYPRIREYLAKHYVELEGSGGLLLIDTRRQPTGTFGALGFPCFR